MLSNKKQEWGSHGLWGKIKKERGSHAQISIYMSREEISKKYRGLTNNFQTPCMHTMHLWVFENYTHVCVWKVNVMT